MKAVKPNVKEYEISALMQYEWGRRGCERPSYASDRRVGSQFHGAPLLGETANTMKAGDVVVIDAAAEDSDVRGGYHADVAG